MKGYKIKVSKANLQKLRIFWRNFKNIENKFYNEVRKLEEVMEKETGIKGIEFFYCDNECVGIGNADTTMRLIQRDKLE